MSSGPRLLLADPVEGLYEASWTPDGRALVYRRGGTLTNNQFDISHADLSPDGGPPTPIVDSPAAEVNPALSPDGRWLAYVTLLDWSEFGFNANHPLWDVAPDDQRFITVGFPDETPGRYILVQNYAAELGAGRN